MIDVQTGIVYHSETHAYVTVSIDTGVATLVS